MQDINFNRQHSVIRLPFVKGSSMEQEQQSLEFLTAFITQKLDKDQNHF